MRFKIPPKSIRKFFLYGACSDPVSKRYGNGWLALLLGATHRASPMGLWAIAIDFGSAPGSAFNFSTIFAVVAFFIYCFFFEWHLIRHADNKKAAASPSADKIKVLHQLSRSSAKASIIFLIYMGIYSSIEKLTSLHVNQTLSLVIAAISLFLGAFLPKLYGSSDRAP